VQRVDPWQCLNVSFDPADEDWVTVEAKGFLFEPLGASFEPKFPGSILVRFGYTTDRHRGVEVSALEGGWASVWTPIGARVYWLPEGRPEDADTPWQARLQEVDYETGSLK